MGERLIPADCKSAASGYGGSNPPLSTNLFFMEAWQSPVYCNGLENRRIRNGSVSSNLTASTINGPLAQSGLRRRPVTAEITGSNPVRVAKECIPSVMAALQSPKLSVGVRVPGGTPSLSVKVQGSDRHRKDI